MTSSKSAKIVNQRQIKTGIWTFLSICGAVVAILLLSAIDNPNGTPWLESSAIAQTLATLGVIAAAILPSLLGTRRDTAIVREQVQNSHDVNFRDDNDAKHDIILMKIDQMRNHMETRFDGQASDIRGLRKDIGRNTDQIDSTSTAVKRLDAKFEEHKQAVADELHEIRVSTDSIAIVKPKEESHD